MARDTNKQDEKTARLLTGDEVAAILNISRAFAYQLMRDGTIPNVRIGRSIRIRPEDLRNFISQDLERKTK